MCTHTHIHAHTHTGKPGFVNKLIGRFERMQKHAHTDTHAPPERGRRSRTMDSFPIGISHAQSPAIGLVPLNPQQPLSLSLQAPIREGMYSCVCARVCVRVRAIVSVCLSCCFTHRAFCVLHYVVDESEMDLTMGLGPRSPPLSRTQSRKNSESASAASLSTTDAPSVASASTLPVPLPIHARSQSDQAVLSLTRKESLEPQAQTQAITHVQAHRERSREKESKRAGGDESTQTQPDASASVSVSADTSNSAKPEAQTEAEAQTQTEAERASTSPIIQSRTVSLLPSGAALSIPITGLTDWPEQEPRTEGTEVAQTVAQTDGSNTTAAASTSSADGATAT